MQNPNQNKLKIVEYKKYRVTGLVQGIFYRQSTQQKATELSLMGWVQNQSNGDVMACAKGLPEQITELEAWLKIGPLKARVSAVILLPLTPEEITQLDNLNNFIIVR